jgi:hypothetical protein|tara:strand:+ start:1692 stop:1829 length:138 start_codon:yes stop_codon:yes gene_type:complete
MRAVRSDTARARVLARGTRVVVVAVVAVVVIVAAFARIASPRVVG